MEAIILAGGLGTRLRAVVPDLPKPMAPVKGRPFLEYQMDYWIGQGINRIILSVGYKKEVIKQHFGPRYRTVEVVYAEEEQPLGTGGALLNAVGYLEGGADFLALNGDTYFEVLLSDVRVAHKTKDADMTLALFQLDDSDRYSGVRLGTASEIVRFGRRGDPQREPLGNGGVYLVNKRVLRDVSFPLDRPWSLEDELLPELLRRGRRIFGHVVTRPFFDIGLPKDYRRAQELLT